MDLALAVALGARLRADRVRRLEREQRLVAMDDVEAPRAASEVGVELVAARTASATLLVVFGRRRLRLARAGG